MFWWAALLNVFRIFAGVRLENAEKSVFAWGRAVAAKGVAGWFGAVFRVIGWL